MQKAHLPQRIQRKRTKGWSAPPGALYIGRTTRHAERPSLFANPYPVSTYGRTGALTLFRQFLATLPAWDLAGRLEALAPYDYLMCWCPLVDRQGQPVPCHGDVWLELLATRPPAVRPPGAPA